MLREDLRQSEKKTGKRIAGIAERAGCGSRTVEGPGARCPRLIQRIFVIANYIHAELQEMFSSCPCKMRTVFISLRADLDRRPAYETCVTIHGKLCRSGGRS